MLDTPPNPSLERRGNKRILVLNITPKCNMNCQFCFGPEKEGEEITNTRAKKIIDEARSKGIKNIVFTGGEPLLCSYIYEILSYAKKEGLYVILHTNGLLLNWEKIQKLEKIIDQINLPLDGYDEKTNSKMRLPGHFKKIMKILDLLKNSNIRVIISTVVTARNKYFIDKVGKILPSFIYKWRIFQFSAKGKAKKFAKELAMSGEDFAKIKKEIQGKDYHFKIQFVSKDDKGFEESYYLI